VRYLSLFSGFEGATLAWKPLGWECAAVAEIDPAACSVLAHHYPDVPNLGDITKVTEQQIKDLGHIDIVIFGSPCQDVSIAGKRAGMKGARSGLFFTAMRVVRWSGARYALWENVPGVFSDNEGRGFAAVVGEMAGVHVDVPDGGWRNSGFFLGVEALVEWAVLDAQFFGVPQRRRRVFALRDSGDWQSRPPILLERESLCGNSPPRREAGERVASSFTPSFHGGYADGIGTLRSNRGDLGGGSESLIATDVDCDGGVIASTGEVSHCLNAGGMGRQDFETETLITFMASDYSSRLQRVLTSHALRRLSLVKASTPARTGPDAERRLWRSEQQKKEKKMGPKPKPTPLKFCATCGSKLERKRLKSGELESLLHFNRRPYCNRECMKIGFRAKPKTGISWAVTHKHARRMVPPGPCSVCGKPSALDVHHKNGDHRCNSPDNLQRICRSCHIKLHHSPRLCSVCGNPQKGLGYCEKHYQRFKKYGDPLLLKRNQNMPLVRLAE